MEAIIYRLEYPDGLGFYQGTARLGWFATELCSLRERWSSFPPLYDDTELIEKLSVVVDDLSVYRFAFNSLDKFLAFVEPWQFEKLKEYGCEFRIYQVAEPISSKWQTMYKPELATHLGNIETYEEAIKLHNQSLQSYQPPVLLEPQQQWISYHRPLNALIADTIEAMRQTVTQIQKTEIGLDLY